MPFVDPGFYQDLGERGRGGIGIVRRARDLRLDRVVALKELQRLGSHARERFEREMRITARLEHPGIVPVHECGLWPDGAPFYAMKLIQGESLKELIARRQSFEQRLALLPNVIAVVDAVAYAHDQQVIHRDLKPSNVIVGPFGETVVIDWGLAKDLRARDVPSSELAVPYRDQLEPDGTRIGDVLGTPAYMSPEQARGEAVDQRTDVYALGAILYHLIDGRAPLEGSSDEIVARRLAGEEPVLHTRDAPRALQAIVRKAMAPSVANRYQTAQELGSDLKRFSAGQLVAAHSYSLRELAQNWLQRNRRLVVIGGSAAAIFACLLILSAIRIISERDRAEDALVLANEQREQALASREAALRNANELILVNAERELQADPTAALAWLKIYPSNGEEPQRAQHILEDARSRGVARYVLPFTGTDGAPSFVGTRLFAVGSGNNVVRLFDLTNGNPVGVLSGTAMPISMKVSSSGRWLVATRKDGGLTAFDVVGRREQPFVLAGGTTASIAVAPLDDRVAVADSEQRVEIFEIASATLRARSPALGTPIFNVVFSPDGKFIAVTGRDALHLIDAGTGAVVRRVPGFLGYHVRFSPDGKTLVSSGSTDDVEFVDLVSGRRYRGKGHQKRTFRMATSNELGIIFTAGLDSTVRFWDYNGKLLETLRNGDDQINSIAVGRGGKAIAYGGIDGIVYVRDLLTKQSWMLRGHDGVIREVAISPDGRWIASTSADESVRIWPFPEQGGESIETGFDGIFHLESVGDRVLADSRDGKIALFSFGSASWQIVADELSPVFALAVSPDRERFATGSWTGEVRQRRLSAGGAGAAQLSAANHGGKPVDMVTYAPAGEPVASVGADGSVDLWWPSSGQSRRLRQPADARCRVAFDRKSSVIYLADSSGSFGAVPLDGSRYRLIRVGAPIVSSTSAPYADLVALGREDGSVDIYRGSDGNVRTFHPGEERVRAMRFAPAARWLAWSDSDGTVYVLDLEQNELRELDGHTEDVRGLNFSPDARLLASASADKTVRVWNLETRAVHILRGHRENVMSVIFSPDGTLLMSAGEGGTVRIWPVQDIAWPAVEWASTRSLLNAMTNAVIRFGKEPATSRRIVPDAP